MRLGDRVLMIVNLLVMVVAAVWAVSYGALGVVTVAISDGDVRELVRGSLAFAIALPGVGLALVGWWSIEGLRGRGRTLARRGFDLSPDPVPALSEGSALRPVEIESRVGPDGVLSLRVSMGQEQANVRVKVTVQPVPDGAPGPTASDDDWHRFVEETYGSCGGSGLEREPQGGVEQRDHVK